MTDGDDEVKIEINTPPKSIEISPLGETKPPTDAQPTVSQTPVLTGGIQQAVQQSLLNTDPGNVKFVMGPNGQLIAMHQPPFVWKDFFIGGGIPFALFFIPILILMIGSGLGFDESVYEEIEITKEENSTAYYAEITLGEEEYLGYCNIFVNSQEPDQIDLSCEITGDRDAKIYDRTNDEVVGYYNGDNGTFYFDSGIDYGTQLYLEYDYYKEDGLYMFFQSISELAGFTCCLGLLLSIVFLILGFSQGKPGMGWGGVSALISFPVVSILGLAFMW